MRETYIGDDGYKHCKQCSKRIERDIEVPLFDGTGRKKTQRVNVLCDCDIKEREALKEAERVREELDAIRRLKSASLLDERLKDATLDNFKVDQTNEKTLKIIKNYIERFDEMLEHSQGLLFYGDVGTGKSYATAVIANELMNRRQTVMMTSFTKLLDEFKNFNVDENKYIENLNSVKLLIIDDLGAERSTDFALEKVYNVIDRRYRSRKPIILTTNLSLEDMKNCTDIRYNRVYDRIFEMCYPVKFDGTSWRRAEARERFKRAKEMLEG